MPSWKPKCQTVWHTRVQGLINCPAHCFHPKLQAGLRDSESPKQFIWKFQTLQRGLPKLPKCWLFIWKAIIMFTWGGRWGEVLKAGRCLNTAVTLCAWVCPESFISISIDVRAGSSTEEMANTHCAVWIVLLELDVLTSLIYTMNRPTAPIKSCIIS